MNITFYFFNRLFWKMTGLLIRWLCLHLLSFYCNSTYSLRMNSLRSWIHNPCSNLRIIQIPWNHWFIGDLFSTLTRRLLKLLLWNLLKLWLWNLLKLFLLLGNYNSSSSFLNYFRLMSRMMLLS